LDSPTHVRTPSTSPGPISSTFVLKNKSDLVETVRCKIPRRKYIYLKEELSIVLE